MLTEESIRDFDAAFKRESDGTPHRTPPCNLEAEQALLGALLINNSRIDQTGKLLPDHFFDPLHAAIFQSISDSVTAGQPATPVTLKALFEATEGPGMTGARYLGRLAVLAGTEPAAYANIITECSTRRRLILVAEDMAAAAYDVKASPAATIAASERDLAALADVDTARVEVTFDTAIDRAVKEANAAYGRGGRMSGVATGLADLDERLGGLQPSDLIILAGRPAIGKSALATNIAINVAAGVADPQTGEVIEGHVHFFSMEMSASQLASRVLAARAEMSSDNLRRGRFSDADFSRRIMPRSKELQRLPVTIDETGGISMARLAARARRLKRRRDTKLIVIDYLQLIASEGRRGDGNRVQELTAITMSLKALAKELDVPIIALSQLSRKVEERADKRPQLADLRESGSIEQDADVVMFVYRDEYYLSREQPPETDDDGMPNPKLAKWRDRMANATGKAEVIIAKHRHGPTGIVNLAFDGSRTQFSNLARSQDGT